MIRIFICVMILLLPQSLWSQEDICIGKSYIFSSFILGKNIQYQVALPAGYNSNYPTGYPVIYLLDGDKFFHVTDGILRMYANGKNPYPECILIGIASNDRMRDFTPTASVFDRNGNPDSLLMPQGGGSDAFLRFMSEEFCPYIRSNYNVSCQEILIGHSFGGLFVLHALFSEPSLFSHYMAIDPSFWWDRGSIIEFLFRQNRLNPLSGKWSYIGIAGTDPNIRKTIHSDKAKEFISVFSSRIDNHTFYNHFFPEESHGTVFIPALLDGLNQLFRK